MTMLASSRVPPYTNPRTRMTLLIGFDSAWTPNNSGAIAAALYRDDGSFQEIEGPRAAQLPPVPKNMVERDGSMSLSPHRRSSCSISPQSSRTREASARWRASSHQPSAFGSAACSRRTYPGARCSAHRPRSGPSFADSAALPIRFHPRSVPASLETYPVL